MNHIERVHLLSLVLMQALDLNIVDGIVIQSDALRLFQIILKFCFSRTLYRQKLVKYCFVVYKCAKLLQFLRILLKARSDQGLDQLGQLVVAVQQPAAECDTVRLIVELLRINLVEVIQLGVL